MPYCKHKPVCQRGDALKIFDSVEECERAKLRTIVKPVRGE